MEILKDLASDVLVASAGIAIITGGNLRFWRLQRVLSSNNRNRTVNAGQHPERPSFDLLSSRGEDGKGMLRMGGDRAFLDYMIISNPARSHSHFVCSFSSQLNARALE